MKTKTKQQILEMIEELIDHYEPYRPLTDSDEMVAVRRVLTEVLEFARSER